MGNEMTGVSSGRSDGDRSPSTCRRIGMGTGRIEPLDIGPLAPDEQDTRRAGASDRPDLYWICVADHRDQEPAYSRGSRP